MLVWCTVVRCVCVHRLRLGVCVRGCRDYKEYHTDVSVKFVVKMTPEKLAQAEQTGLHKVFKLQCIISSNLVRSSSTHHAHLTCHGVSAILL